MYGQLTKADIIGFYEKCLKSGRKWMFLAGKVDDKLLQKLEDLFGQIPNNKLHPEVITQVDVNNDQEVVHFDMPNSVQTSLRLFRPLFTRQHQDFPEMFLLSIVFGGYFGSRLMKNIREDEGLTYGIYASLDNLRHSGYFYISTETKHNNTSLVLKLIEEEMNKMSETLCSEEELLMVKRYIAGQFLRMMDGPLNVIKVYRTLALDGLKSDFYNELLNSIWRCTAKDLQETAQSYLRPDQFSLVTVGKQIKTAHLK
jgi:predicted Zn-dependent peptidase